MMFTSTPKEMYPASKQAPRAEAAAPPNKPPKVNLPTLTKLTSSTTNNATPATKNKMPK